MAYDIGPRIGIDGETEFRDAIRNVNQQVRTLTSEMSLMVTSLTDSNDAEELLAEQSRILNQQISAQEEKITLLTRGLDASAEKYTEANTKTLQWKESVNKATTELNKMRSQLAKVESDMDTLGAETDDAADSLDDFGDSAGDAEPGLGDFLGQLSNLKNMVVGGVIATGVKEIAGTILELEESTREYRQIMGTLVTSSQAAGYSAEETQAAYERLYGVLGDTQATATTLANLQAIGLGQGALMSLIDATTGAWSKYGDSIPIDGLAEAINETIRAGQVTGNFADVLNWGTDELETFGIAQRESIEFTKLSQSELDKLTESELAEYEAKKAQYEATEDWNTSVQEATTAEDKFNLALQQCKSDTERAALVIRTMSEQDLVGLGQAWRDTNEDIVKANESQAKMEEAMGRMGELVAPLADGLRSLGADAIEWLADKIEDFLPMLEGMAEAAGMLWDALFGNSSGPTYIRGQRVDTLNTRGVDGSYATGLYRVPYDGFTPELHKNEMIIPASLADMIRSSGGNDFSALASGVVNGVQTAMTGMNGGSYTFNLVLPDGTLLAQYQLPALIDVAKANGTPILNPVNG